MATKPKAGAKPAPIFDKNPDLAAQLRELAKEAKQGDVRAAVAVALEVLASQHD